MKTFNDNRFSTLVLGPKAILRNRVVVPPMASQTATVDGRVTLETRRHYSRLAQSGAGLVMVEYSFVHISGRSEERQLGIFAEEQIEGLGQIAQEIHNYGALAGIQLTHSGGKSSFALTHGLMMGPSPISVPVKDQTLEVPLAMSPQDIALWKDSFLQAARRATLAGFDLVELHAAHGYGLNQWLSALTNQRTDRYGGTLKNRARLLLEIVAEIKAHFPDLILAARIPGQDLLPGGLTPEEMIEVSQWLEAAGLNLLDVSSGLGGWRRPKERHGEGYLVTEAARIQANVRIPVIGVGGIQTPEYIDQVIGHGDISLAAVGRAILENPIRFKNLVFKGVSICPS